MNLVDRVKAYAGALPILLEWTVTGRVVAPDIAQKRADVCTGRESGFACPKNKPDFQLAEDISAVVRKHVALKNRLQLRVQGEKDLHTCEACACPLKTKIWMELTTIRPLPEEESKYAVNCWLLHENP